MPWVLRRSAEVIHDLALASDPGQVTCQQLERFALQVPTHYGGGVRVRVPTDFTKNAARAVLVIADKNLDSIRQALGRVFEALHQPPSAAFVNSVSPRGRPERFGVRY